MTALIAARRFRKVPTYMAMIRLKITTKLRSSGSPLFVFLTHECDMNRSTRIILLLAIDVLFFFIELIVGASSA